MAPPQQSRPFQRLPENGPPPREDWLKLSEPQRDHINEAFGVFDMDNDGRVDYIEFRFILRSLGFEPPKEETYPYLVKYGVQPANWTPDKGECRPTFREFDQAAVQALAAAYIARRDPIEEFRRSFRMFDEGGKGLITVDDLRRVANDLGNETSEKDLQAMVDTFDSSNKGGVNEDEYIKMMMSAKR